jgi:UDP-glucose 4-epimerase
VSSRASARRVAVTGANGLLGRAVIRRLLADGAEVIAIVRPGTEDFCVPGAQPAGIDLSANTGQAFAAVGAFDAAVHLAQAQGWRGFPAQAGLITAVNISAASAFAEAACQAGARTFVYASSGGIHGPSPSPITESAPVRPAGELGFYLAAKAAAETLLGHFTPHITLHILRPFFVYGPGQAEAFLVPRLVKAIRSGTPIPIAGQDGTRLNPVYVEDAAAAFVAALDAGEPVTANVAGPEIVSIREIVEAIAARLGRPARFEFLDRAADQYVADTSVMNQRLYQPTIRLGMGLEQLLTSPARR